MNFYTLIEIKNKNFIDIIDLLLAIRCGERSIHIIINLACSNTNTPSINVLFSLRIYYYFRSECRTEKFVELIIEFVLRDEELI